MTACTYRSTPGHPSACDSARTTPGARTSATAKSYSNDACRIFEPAIGWSRDPAAVPQDFLNRRNEWARSVFDRPHRMSFNYTYEIPWFHSALPC